MAAGDSQEYEGILYLLLRFVPANQAVCDVGYLEVVGADEPCCLLR